MKLQSKDLIKGKYYGAYYPSCDAIFICENGYECSISIVTNNLSNLVVKGRFGAATYFMDATEEQRRHLDASIAAGKYVPCPQLQILEIY